MERTERGTDESWVIPTPKPISLHLSLAQARRWGPRGKSPPRALSTRAPPIIQVKPPRAAHHRGRYRSASRRSSFLSLSAPGLCPKLLGSELEDTPTCRGLRPGRGRSKSKRAQPSRPTQRARESGGAGDPAPSTHRDCSSPCPNPVPSAPDPRPPIHRPPSPLRAARTRSPALTRSARQVRGSQKQDPQQWECNPAVQAGHGSGRLGLGGESDSGR